MRIKILKVVKESHSKAFDWRAYYCYVFIQKSLKNLSLHTETIESPLLISPVLHMAGSLNSKGYTYIHINPLPPSSTAICSTLLVRTRGRAAARAAQQVASDK